MISTLLLWSKRAVLEVSRRRWDPSGQADVGDNTIIQTTQPVDSLQKSMPQSNITTSSNPSDSFRTQIPSIIVEQNKLQTLPGSTDSASPVVIQATTPVTYAQEVAKTTLPAPISSIQSSQTNPLQNEILSSLSTTSESESPIGTVLAAQNAVHLPNKVGITQVATGESNKSTDVNWLLASMSLALVCGLFVILLFRHKRTKT